MKAPMMELVDMLELRSSFLKGSASSSLARSTIKTK